ncbi:thiolase family protein [Acrocarpospora catenulata]|uniref:thiolase family protein n=1 Tax=Acrocarpospora catenulata TaxID=2836182 RepID=UPI001BDA30D4|nr:thiolase family protein [Acrocarpospora catenulata]
MTAHIWGVGSSAFGKQPGRSTAALAWEAVGEAMSDAGVRRFDAVYVGNVFGEPGMAARALLGLGIHGLPVHTLESACASSAAALAEAKHAVESGRHETVLVLGLEHLTSRFAGALPAEPRDFEGRSGLATPAMYAMAARRYLDVHGVTAEQLAKVAVKNQGHGMGNPRAQYRNRVTVDEVLASRMISDPLTLLQCCSLSDAAAALVVGPRRRTARDVAVAAAEYTTGGLWDHTSEHVWGFELARDTAARAYERSGIGPADADLFEVHDAFTIGEIVSTEALGLAAVGEGARLLDTGHTALGGKQPVNPSGGLLSRGHPVGATGAAQACEAVWQLRGEAAGRQVEGARAAVIETLGGGVGLMDGNACVVAVLTR